MRADSLRVPSNMQFLRIAIIVHVWIRVAADCYYYPDWGYLFSKAETFIYYVKFIQNFMKQTLIMFHGIWNFFFSGA